jgi:hypothetical protein
MRWYVSNAVTEVMYQITERRKMKNPYPPTITDEASGIIVANNNYTVWLDGYAAALTDIGNFAFALGQCQEALAKLNVVTGKKHEG